MIAIYNGKSKIIPRVVSVEFSSSGEHCYVRVVGYDYVINVIKSNLEFL